MRALQQSPIDSFSINQCQWGDSHRCRDLFWEKSKFWPDLQKMLPSCFSATLNSPGLTESQFPQELLIHAASINKYTFPMSELFFARSPPSQPRLPWCGTYFFWPQTIQKCTPSNRPAGPLSNRLDYMVRRAGHRGHNEHGKSWEGRGRCNKSNPQNLVGTMRT